MSSSRTRSTEETDVEEFANQNEELLSRLLVHGGAEARGYALAIIANGATVDTIDEVQAQLYEIRREIS